jgi:ABC-2 type transport system permease protein
VGSLSIYRALLAAQLRAQTSYRGSFVIDLSANALIPLIDLAAVVALFRVTPSLGGFSAAEVLVIFGLSATSFALADLLVGNIERIRVYVRAGTLDAALVRPLSVLGQVLSLDFTIRRVARLAVAVAVLAVAVWRADVVFSPPRVALLLVAPLFGALFFAAIFVATATVAFWWIDSGEFANSFTYGGRDFTSYPITVYGAAFRRVFAYALGFAFVGYYPALALFGRADPLGLPAWVGWSSPAVSVAAAFLAAIVWRFGIRRYRSTGS